MLIVTSAHHLNRLRAFGLPLTLYIPNDMRFESLHDPNAVIKAHSSLPNNKDAIIDENCIEFEYLI